MRSSIVAAVSALAVSVQAIDTISAYGAKFFTSSGAQWYIKGVAYQLTPSDPLIDGDQCSRDASLMKTLGANAIRVYHVDPTADHDSCMSTFADAGIYLFVDLDTFTTAISGSSPAWNETQYEAFAAVMDAFQQYDNTAGFFVGNEVMDTSADSVAAPYVKAAARDMKAYRDAKGYREIPIGYSAADIASLRPNLQNYLTCSSNSSENIDFFSLNAYEWCGDNTYTGSGYSQLQEMAAEYPIPIFFSETGCNTPEPRTFGDQAAILGPDMDGTWSGAIIYEWIQEENDYGLISYGPTVAATVVATNVQDGFSRAGTPTPVSPDFSNLSAQWATLTPSGVSSADYTPSFSNPSCPAYTTTSWEVDPSAALPTLGDVYVGSGTTTTGTSTKTGTSTGTATGKSTGTSTSSSATSTATGAASADKQIAGMCGGLVTVMLGVIAWL